MMNEHFICKVADIAEGEHRIFAVDTFEFGVFREGDKVIGWENRCPHSGGPVCQGLGRIPAQAAAVAEGQVGFFQ